MMEEEGDDAPWLFQGGKAGERLLVVGHDGSKRRDIARVAPRQVVTQRERRLLVRQGMPDGVVEIRLRGLAICHECCRSLSSRLYTHDQCCIYSYWDKIE